MVGEILSNFRSIFFLAEEIPSQQILKNRKKYFIRKEQGELGEKVLEIESERDVAIGKGQNTKCWQIVSVFSESK